MKIRQGAAPELKKFLPHTNMQNINSMMKKIRKALSTFTNAFAVSLPSSGMNSLPISATLVKRKRDYIRRLASTRRVQSNGRRNALTQGLCWHYQTAVPIQEIEDEVDHDQDREERLRMRTRPSSASQRFLCPLHDITTTGLKALCTQARK